MARGNQREKAREKNLKEQGGKGKKTAVYTGLYPPSYANTDLDSSLAPNSPRQRKTLPPLCARSKLQRKQRRMLEEKKQARRNEIDLGEPP